MKSLLRSAFVAGIGFLPMTASQSQAQGYQVDCAILLCLSGGWPASAPCAHARAVFIRRITPWPIEPPLQIWRCPMRAAHETRTPAQSLNRLLEANFGDRGPQQSLLGEALELANIVTQARAMVPEVTPPLLQHVDNLGVSLDAMLHLAQSVGTGADIDVSDPAFDFIRSINVFQVQLNQRESGRDDDCNRSANVRRGTYDTTGQFRWRDADYSQIPAAFIGDERYPSNCPNVRVRSVFVDWRDYDGNYGFEQVNY